MLVLQVGVNDIDDMDEAAMEKKNKGKSLNLNYCRIFTLNKYSLWHRSVYVCFAGLVHYIS